jgi:hypothetical protein
MKKELTEEQKEAHRIANRKSYNKNKEKRKELIKIKNKAAYERNKKWHIEYIEKHKEERKEYNKKWYSLNNPKKEKETDPEKIKQINKTKKNEYQKNRKQTDTLYRLKCNFRSYFSNMLKNKGFKKKIKTHEILGCSYIEFKEYLESKFEPWMNWGNYGLYNGTLNYGWDIDHIIPQSSANTEEELLKLNHFSNLQPLCSYTNRVVKSNI